MKYVVATVPEYLKHFQCTGSECEENCCATNWCIYVNKKIYKKYRDLKKSDMKSLMDKYITRNRSNFASDDSYAKINFGTMGHCPFINEAKLCSVQLELGEEFLPDICANYPRYVNVVDGEYECSASTSCSEVARVALLEEQGIKFEKVELDLRERKLINFSIDTRRRDAKYYKYFHELRSFTIQVLKSRDYELWERLVVLGLFYQNLEEAFKQKKEEEIECLIEKYINLVIQGDIKNELAKIPVMPKMQLEILSSMLRGLCSEEIDSDCYMECLSAVLEGLQLSAEAINQKTEMAYKEAYEEYYLPFLKQYEYILENYLVNFVFRTLYPFSGEKRVFDNYVTLIVHYSLLQMHLIGMAGFYKDNFNTDLVIKLISSFGKVIEQNSEYLNRVKNFIKDNQFDSMKYMAILIKI